MFRINWNENYLVELKLLLMEESNTMKKKQKNTIEKIKQDIDWVKIL